MSLSHHSESSSRDIASSSLSSARSAAKTGESSVDIDELVRQVVQEVSPLWTLERFVAVNPFMAFTGRPLMEVALKMQRWLDADLYPALPFYRQRAASGLLTIADLNYAVKARPSSAAPAADVALNFLRNEVNFAQRKGAISDRRYDRLIASNAAKWLSSLLGDTGAIWQPHDKVEDLYAAWLALVIHDRSLDIEGFGSVRKELKKLSSFPQDVFRELLKRLSSSHIAAGPVFRRLSYRNYGWLSYSRFLDREAARENTQTSLAYQVLAIQTAYELAFLRSGSIDLSSLAETVPAADERLDGERLQLLDLFQEAAEHGARRALLAGFSAGKICESRKVRPRLQAVFCIDARSEIYRRNLESLSPDVQSLGFAGFFGLTLANESAFGGSSSRCPVLLKSSFEATLLGEKKPKRTLSKTAAIAKKLISTTFSYVEAYGLLYLPLMVRDMFLASHKSDSRTFTAARFTLIENGASLSTEAKVSIAKGILKHSGLRSRMGRLVLLCGHGSSSANNPHASGLDCGACGGHRGDINAIAAVAILNDRDVREALRATPYEIPGDSCFIAGLHNTTTGTVTLYEEDRAPATHAPDVAELKRLLAAASALSIRERAASENWRISASRTQNEAELRAASIGEIRPEWGLARNVFFIAARRETTLGMNLGGRSFLHDYDQSGDEDGATLELILTAPLVVAQWINMQYYASTVDNRVFGSGSKLLHSAIGSFGVLEGVDCNLRVGLPWQSVHNGQNFVHEPLRLQAFVEATPASIDLVLAKHSHIADLVINKWITLIAIGSKGECPQRCFGPGRWRPEV